MSRHRSAEYQVLPEEFGHGVLFSATGDFVSALRKANIPLHKAALAAPDLWTEVAMLERLLYKNANQHRTTRHWAKLEEVRRQLRLIKQLRLPDMLAELHAAICTGCGGDPASLSLTSSTTTINITTTTNNNNDNNSSSSSSMVTRGSGTDSAYSRRSYRLPPREAVAWVLRRLLCGTCLLQALPSAAAGAAGQLGAQMALTYFMPLCLAASAMLARVQVLALQLLLDCVKAYNSLADLLPVLQPADEQQPLACAQLPVPLARAVYAPARPQPASHNVGWNAVGWSAGSGRNGGGIPADASGSVHGAAASGASGQALGPSSSGAGGPGIGGDAPSSGRGGGGGALSSLARWLGGTATAQPAAAALHSNHPGLLPARTIPQPLSLRQSAAAAGTAPTTAGRLAAAVAEVLDPHASGQQVEVHADASKLSHQLPAMLRCEWHEGRCGACVTGVVPSEHEPSWASRAAELVDTHCIMLALEVGRPVTKSDSQKAAGKDTTAQQQAGTDKGRRQQQQQQGAGGLVDGRGAQQLQVGGQGRMAGLGATGSGGQDLGVKVDRRSFFDVLAGVASGTGSGIGMRSLGAAGSASVARATLQVVEDRGQGNQAGQASSPVVTNYVAHRGFMLGGGSKARPDAAAAAAAAVPSAAAAAASITPGSALNVPAANTSMGGTAASAAAATQLAALTRSPTDTQAQPPSIMQSAAASAPIPAGTIKLGDTHLQASAPKPSGLQRMLLPAPPGRGVGAAAAGGVSFVRVDGSGGTPGRPAAAAGGVASARPAAAAAALSAAPVSGTAAAVGVGLPPAEAPSHAPVPVSLSVPVATATPAPLPLLLQSKKRSRSTGSLGVTSPQAPAPASTGDSMLDVIMGIRPAGSGNLLNKSSSLTAFNSPAGKSSSTPPAAVPQSGDGQAGAGRDVGAGVRPPSGTGKGSTPAAATASGSGSGRGGNGGALALELLLGGLGVGLPGSSGSAGGRAGNSKKPRRR